MVTVPHDIGIVYGPPEQMLTTARVFFTEGEETVGNAAIDDMSVHVRSIPLSSLTSEPTKDLTEFYIACGHFSRLLGHATSIVSQVDVIEFGSKHQVKVAFDATKKAFKGKEVRNDKAIFNLL